MYNRLDLFHYEYRNHEKNNTTLLLLMNRICLLRKFITLQMIFFLFRVVGLYYAPFVHCEIIWKCYRWACDAELMTVVKKNAYSALLCIEIKFIRFATIHFLEYLRNVNNRAIQCSSYAHCFEIIWNNITILMVIICLQDVHVRFHLILKTNWKFEPRAKITTISYLHI